MLQAEENQYKPKGCGKETATVSSSAIQRYVTDTERQELFNMFYNLGSPERQRDFVCRHCHIP